MKVGFYCDGWPTFAPMHGPARYVQTLARGLVARGVEVHVVTAHGEDRDLVEDGYHVHARRAPRARVVSRVQPGIGESFHLWRAIERLHRTHRFDVVELTNVEGAGFFTALLGRMPTLVRVHTTAFDAARLALGKAELELGYARLERWTAHRATALVTHTRTHLAQAAADYGLPEARFHLVPHGIAPTPPDRAVTRRPAQVLSVGSATPRKGVGRFLEAAERLAAEVEDARFVWAGKDGPTSPSGTTWAEHARAKHPSLDGRLAFQGGLSDGGIASLYAESGVYLCTSIYESFGLTMVEAMMADLPVVAPRTAAMAEIITDGETGWLYDPDDPDDLVRQVRAALGSPAERERVARAARRMAEAEYSAATMTSRMLDLYRGLL